jgi:hypothetical protein
MLAAVFTYTQAGLGAGRLDEPVMPARLVGIFSFYHLIEFHYSSLYFQEIFHVSYQIKRK